MSRFIFIYPCAGKSFRGLRNTVKIQNASSIDPTSISRKQKFVVPQIDAGEGLRKLPPKDSLQKSHNNKNKISCNCKLGATQKDVNKM